MPIPHLWVRQQSKQFLIDGLPFYKAGHKIEGSAGESPDGIFVEWSWNSSSLIVHNDRYSFYPLYYFVRPGEIALSTSIPRLVELIGGAELDDAAMAVFLRLGFFIGDDTPFKHIRAVPRCSAFRWESGELKIRQEAITVKTESINRESAIDVYISLFRRAVQRRAPTDHNFAVPISRGRDSRHILLELYESGYKPEHCVTADIFPYAVSEDVQVARQLTAALSLNHIVITQPSARLTAELRKNLETNFCADEHTWYLPVADYLRERTNIVYDGIGGDVLSAGLFLDRQRLEHFDAGNFSELARLLLFEEEATEGGLAAILHAEDYKRFNRELAASHIEEELKRYADYPNPVGAFFFANRTRREIALSPYGLLAGIEKVFSPYLDHDLYDFLSFLPASMFLEHNFHTETIRQAYPSYAYIPFAKKLDAAVRSRKYFRKFTLDLMAYAFRQRPLNLVRSDFLIPRLMRCLVDSRYSNSVNWFGPLAVYLTQIQGFLLSN
jgi:hypothetical protein